MQPQQPYTPPPSKPNQFDFILSPDKPKKAALLPGASGGGGGLKQRILLVAVGVFGLVVILSIGAALLNSGKNGPIKALVELTQEQQEIIRVAGLGIQGSADPSTRGVAYTVSLSLTSQQVRLLAYLKSKGQPVSPKILGVKKDSKVDSALETAKFGGRYDDAFLAILHSQMATYAQNAQNSYKMNKDKAAQKFLADAINTAVLLSK